MQGLRCLLTLCGALPETDTIPGEYHSPNYARFPQHLLVVKRVLNPSRDLQIHNFPALRLRQIPGAFELP